MPQLSFGKGTRPGGGGDALPFDGADATVSPGGTMTANQRPTLAAGTYYLAVNNGDTDAAYGAALFNVTPSTEANTGSFTVRARYMPVVTPIAPDSTELGTLAGNQSLTATIDADTYFVWYRFTISDAANDTTGKYVDIDTANTGLPLNDTNVALYNAAGQLQGLNDDIAPGWGNDNPTGGNSALSFGAGTPARDYASVNANLPQGDGRDGPLAAGTYYLQVSPCCAGYGDNNFWVINDYVTNPDLADITVHINANYGSLCGAADIGSAGGLPGADGHLNNNDFIAFITYFFAQNPIADMGTVGGLPGHDSQWNNNDFIAFINYFFAGSAACP
ncbi:MAG: GC-type dockerin domain-anchored protein [Phycisphaerales bacterium]